MKALTVCQPYAHLICLPDDHDLAKRVENRPRRFSYVGPLLIHAGKSRDWLERGAEYGVHEADLVFGAIIGACRVAGCFTFVQTGVNEFGRQIHEIEEWAQRKWPWLLCHQHVSGPYCLVLLECRKFAKPIPYRGAQGLFDVPDEVVAEMLKP